MSGRSTTSGLSIGLLTLGAAVAGLGVAKGISNGHLLEAGSNNRAAVLGGLVLVGLGLLLRQPTLNRALSAVLKRSDDETPVFLARVQAKPLFHAGLGLWFGVAAGLLESAYRAYHALEDPWPNSLWLAPLTYGVWFGSVALVLAIPLRVIALPAVRPVLGLLLTMAFSGWIFIVEPRVHPAAAVVLAAGIAVQLSRLLARHAYLVTMAIAYTGRVAILVTIGVMVWMLSSSPVSMAASHVGRPAAGGRNVLLLVLDTVSAGELSMLGYERPTTPNLQRWASRGVVFESAFSTAPWTLPSHAGMFTGRWAHEFGDSFPSTIDGRFPTIAEAMRERGYATSGFVANLAYLTTQMGLGRGFDHYEDLVVSPGQAFLSTALGRAAVDSDVLRNVLGYHELVNRKPASRINANFLRWLDRNRSRPFFAFLNYFDAHEPYMPTEGDATRFRTGPVEDRGAFESHFTNIRHADWYSLSASQVAQEKALHEAAIAAIDREIGALLATLESRGLLGNTVVIVTSDHGEAFGAHGVFEHGNSLYADLLHVPLLIIDPGATRPVRIRESVSLRDLPGTVLDVAGLEGDSPFPGASLSRFWRSSAPPRRREDPLVFVLPAARDSKTSLSARGTMYSVIADPFHYILNGDGIEELFNYRADPLEQNNLAGRPDASSVLPRLRASLPKRVN